MRHSLHSHIIYLEKAIQDVRNRLAAPGLNLDEIQDLELQLTLANGALKHYREAYALELSVSVSEPPLNEPGSKSGGAAGNAGTQPPRKKDGLVGRLALARTLGRRRTPQLRHAHPSGAASRAAI